MRRAVGCTRLSTPAWQATCPLHFLAALNLPEPPTPTPLSNLALLTPFLIRPSIALKAPPRAAAPAAGGARRLEADWSLETWLALPWRPRIAIEGSTLYTLDSSGRIAEHVEAWCAPAAAARPANAFVAPALVGKPLPGPLCTRQRRCHCFGTPMRGCMCLLLPALNPPSAPPLTPGM